MYAMVMNLENFYVGNAQLFRMAQSKARVESERSGGCEVLIQLLLMLVLWSLTRRQFMTPASKLS